MLFMARQIWRNFPHWERPTQIGFVMALVLLIAAFAMVILAPQEERIRFLVAFGVLTLVAQGIVLWGNRGMVAPITQAQRAYMRGDFAGAIAILEPIREAGSADVAQLTLLGNTYRQIGRLDASERVLSEAVDKLANHHYSLYGFGRTLIVQGRYAEGAEYILRALAAGAPPMVRFDLGEAWYRLGRWDEARPLLHLADGEEPHRTLMAVYWRFCMDEGSVPSRAQIQAGLPYWAAQAERFADTDYGRSVAEDVAQLNALLRREE